MSGRHDSIKKELKLPEGLIARLLLLLAFLFVAVAVWNVELNVPLENTRLSGATPTSFDEGWTAQKPSGETALDEVSRPAADAIGETLILTNTLPSPLADMSLCFQTKNESVRVWVGGELVYEYGEEPQKAYGHGVGSVWNIVRLPNDASGEDIEVELVPIGGRTGLAPYRFLLGGRSDIIDFLLRERWSLLTVSLILAVIGIVALLWSIRTHVKRDNRSNAMFYFGLFVLLSSVWMAADSGLLQFVISNKGVIYLLFGFSFYLLCAPFAMFITYALPERRRLFFTFSIISSAYALLRFILYVAGVLDFETALWIVHLMMAAQIASVIFILWRQIIRTRKLERPEFSIAITVFSIVEAAALASFYINNKLNVLRNGYSSGFYFGILLMVVIIAAGAVRQANETRRQAIRADFYERRAYTDELTGLLNVKGFDDKCAELLGSAPAKQSFVLVDFDVNFFSQYNATNGLAEGDELLKKIAEVLKAGCRDDELCARQEADHFVCLLRGGLDSALERINESESSVKGRLSQSMLLISYGIVEVTDRTVSVAALRNQAVIAKRTVKGNYEKSIAVYDSALHENQLRELALLSGFEAALDNKEYVIFLQPKIEIKTNELAGAEALVRHVRPDGTITVAWPIIEALESKGFVAKLDYYILEQVCAFLKRCAAEGLMHYPVSSNFSRVHLYDAEFADKIAEIVDRYEIPHELVEIELTETAFLAGSDILQSAAQSLHSHGFKMSIDDFGSGYSSLTMIKDVEVDAIKLDREFLTDFSSDARADIVIEHTLNIAQKLGIKTVAEGVETVRQLEFLRALGCDYAQGYLYSHPLPEDEFIHRYLPSSEVAATDVTT